MMIISPLPPSSVLGKLQVMLECYKLTFRNSTVDSALAGLLGHCGRIFCIARTSYYLIFNVQSKARVIYGGTQSTKAQEKTINQRTKQKDTSGYC